MLRLALFGTSKGWAAFESFRVLGFWHENDIALMAEAEQELEQSDNVWPKLMREGKQLGIIN